MIEKPLIIDGDSCADERDVLSFVNDFKFNDVKRFYIISDHSEKIIRAWQGHKIERKYFYMAMHFYLPGLMHLSLPQVM